jgi:hypothetical protein
MIHREQTNLSGAQQQQVLVNHIAVGVAKHARARGEVGLRACENIGTEDENKIYTFQYRVDEKYKSKEKEKEVM